MKKIVVSFLFIVIVFFTLIVSSCCIAQNPKKSDFAKGADVGWLPQMEATGYKFYDQDGKETDCLQLLKA